MANSPELQRILDGTECLFTWKLSGNYNQDKLITKFRKILNNDCYVPSHFQTWYIRACLAHQLFQIKNVEAFEEINQAVEELDETDNRLARKCMKSCQHILYATKAFMVSKCNQDGGWWGVEDLPSLQKAVEIIPAKEAMTPWERAGLIGFKEYILTAHNAIGESGRGIFPLTTATRLDPREYEWRISLLAHVVRSGLYIQGKREQKKREDYTIPPRLVKRPRQIIDGLLTKSKLPEDRKISVLYFKAIVEEFYIRNKKKSPEFVATIEMINSLWREILRSNVLNPLFAKYGAKWFLENPADEPACNEQDRNLVFEAVLRIFEKYPKSEECLVAARIVQGLAENITSSSETAQRIIRKLQ